LASEADHALPPRVAFYNKPKFARSSLSLVLLAVVVWLGYEFVLNARANLAAQNISSGFGFLDTTAGFNVNQALIPYQEADTYRPRVLSWPAQHAAGVRAWHRIGDCVRLHHRDCAALTNWLVARIGSGYVEIIRNLPLLFQILFWYLAVLGTLRDRGKSLSLFGVAFLNNRASSCRPVDGR